MKIVFFILFASIFGWSNEGSLDAILNKRTLNCWDVGYNAGELIPKVYKSGAMDSLAAITTYWENKCGMSEPLYRFNLIQNIGSNKKPFTNSDSAIINEMIYYRNRIQDIQASPDQQVKINNWYNYAPPKEFDDLTFEISESIFRNGKDLDKDDSLLLLFYQNKFDAFFDRIYENTEGELAKVYRKRVDNEIHKKKLNMGIITGIWVPMGNATLLGNHPLIGFYMGGQGKKFGVDFDLHFRFLNSENSYNVFHNDSMKTTDHFFGGYIGIDGYYELDSWSNGKMINPGLILGVAADGFDAIEKDEDTGKGSQGVWSFNTNIGVGNKFFYSQSAYLAVEGRFNFVSYSNDKGTDLSGNTISILLKWGVRDNGPARTVLTNMRYSK